MGTLHDIRKELVVKEDAEVPAIPEALAMAGLEEVDQSDLILPRVRVIQPTSKLEGNQGQFHYNLTGEAVDAIHAVLLKMTKSRVCWDRENLGADPLCASNDAKTPRAAVFAPTCAACPMAEWGADGEPPACRLVYNFLAADLDHEDTIFVIGLGATSVKHARRVLSTFALKRKPLCYQPVLIQSVQVTGDKGKWFEITVTPEAAKGFDWRPFMDMYRAYQSVAVEVDVENVAEAVMPDVDEIPF